ncbi:MAG: BamA/TamA family outer membrane protein [Cytophagales bacterium]|nr:BamA/TamA family outer membrane protein [Cytophagales bacterium]
MLVVFLANGCISHEKVLKPNQYLLYSQRIKGNTQVAAAELEPYLAQKPNRRLLRLPIFPYLWLYRQGLRTYSRSKIENDIAETRQSHQKKIEQAGNDSTRVRRLERKLERKLGKLNRQLNEGNRLMRIGEPPVAYDSALAQRGAAQMQDYLRSKGYFNGRAIHTVQLDSARRAQVAYLVTEGERTYVRRVSRETDNAAIDSLLKANQSRELVRPGDGYDAARLGQERDRIDKILKDNGYYNFSRQYVTFAVNDTIRPTDTTERRSLVDITTVVNEPPDGTTHQAYRVDEVYFTEDAGTQGPARRDTVEYLNVHYLARRHRFSQKILNAKILIRPGALYSQQKSVDTQRLLGSLDMFKYANIFYDTTGGQFSAKLYTSPLPKYTYSVEGGGTVTLANGFPGPFGSTNFKIRNVFGGLEVFELRGTGGIEGVAGFGTEVGNRILSSQQLSIVSTLTFPRILFPGRFKYLFDRFSPRTRVQVGYNFTGRPDFRRFGFQGNLTYTWQPSLEKQFNVTVLELNRIFSNYTSDSLGRELQTQIDVVLRNQGSTLWRAFQKAFVSSVSASYTYNSNVSNQRQKARYLRLFAESGGSFLNFNAATNWLRIGNGDVDRNDLQFYRFVKFNVDYRYYLPRKGRSMWAFRVNVGLANPYGPAGTLPYEKFFFSGGSNSVRAWLPRRLGLGSARDSLAPTGNYEYRFEQPGDIILEATAEYRTGFLRFSNFNVDLAFFTDAGNVWLLRPDRSAPNGNFEWNRFYREIAVGSGLGLRFDFSFLLVRFDFATKMFDPGRRPEDQWAVGNIFRPGSVFRRGQSAINFGIGYPF